MELQQGIGMAKSIWFLSIGKGLVLFLCFVSTIVAEDHMKAPFQMFEQVTEESHPAVKFVLALLDSQARRDIESFAACFDPEFPLFVNLQGGHRLRDAKELIKRHEGFYQSSTFQFEYGDLQDCIGNDDFFTCSVPFSVTFPNGVQRNAYLDMTFFKNRGAGPEWIPGRIINTVMDAAQVVAH